MVKVLGWLQSYTAIKPDWDPLPMPCHCDGLSCERCHDAQQVRQNCSTAEDRLEGTVGCVQEWHRRQQFYEVCFSTNNNNNIKYDNDDNNDNPLNIKNE